MTFAARIRRNRKVARATAIGGLSAVAAIAGIVTFFVVFQAVSLNEAGRQIVGVITGLLSLIGFAGGWTARGTYVENVDTVIAHMGSMQRATVVAAIQEDEVEDLDE